MISNTDNTTCKRLAVAAVTLIISPSLATKGWVNNSIVVFAATALTLNKLNTAESLVRVTVIVSALPLSSLTNIDLISAVVDAVEGTAVASVVGTVYIVVALVDVKSRGFHKNVSANEPTPC